MGRKRNMTDEFAPETSGDEAPVEEPTFDPNDTDQDGVVSDEELVRHGPTQEQLEAEPYNTAPDVPEVLLAAARGEEVVTSLPLEVQGGDSLAPQEDVTQDDTQDNTEES
jgi:hypothetical protein